MSDYENMCEFKEGICESLDLIARHCDQVAYAAKKLHFPDRLTFVAAAALQGFLTRGSHDYLADPQWQTAVVKASLEIAVKLCGDLWTMQNQPELPMEDVIPEAE